ncbi:hypothetical protein SAMN05421848_2086 [Kushneria avicenniae]|uniref:Uncharacterized protein n=1 Tax=Kushneria avicenniae TaxID=402385 RepID=A0A1I1KVV2_9GAMM|nr:hypothetical protein SAMN05421848_2086 [Kushneria avicenniae]
MLTCPCIIRVYRIVNTSKGKHISSSASSHREQFDLFSVLFQAIKIML